MIKKPNKPVRPKAKSKVRKVNDDGTRDASLKIEGMMNQYAKGNINASQLRRGVKKLGHTIESLRGKSSTITIYGPNGKGKDYSF